MSVTNHKKEKLRFLKKENGKNYKKIAEKDKNDSSGYKMMESLSANVRF